MTEEYNRVVASHYSAYRPPLHKIILEYVLSKNEIFADGLDIGCGTGYSAIALARYCSQVYGIEPSSAMLSEATQHERIRYLPGFGEAIPLLSSSVDIVTFAGSLFYTKSPALIKELKRVCRTNATIVVYDFEVLLNDILFQCGIDLAKSTYNYDHAINLSDAADFVEIIAHNKQIIFEAIASDLAHILLSTSYNYNAFVKKYNSLNVFPQLVNELKQIQKEYSLMANIYFAKYQLNSA